MEKGRDPNEFFEAFFAHFDNVRSYKYIDRKWWGFNVSKDGKTISTCSKNIVIPARFIDEIAPVRFRHCYKFPRCFLGMNNALRLLSGRRIITIFDKRKNILFLKVIE